MAHILVVDDEQSLNSLMRMVLEINGHVVRQAYDGKSALCMAHESAPDLLLLDIMMPGLSGYDVARALYESDSTKRIPIMFVSAHGKPSDHDVSLAMPPIVDYVSKPFEINDLLRRVHLALDTENTKATTF
jgi:two-component system phosphate regulon response regulator PhoB